MPAASATIGARLRLGDGERWRARADREHLLVEGARRAVRHRQARRASSAGTAIAIGAPRCAVRAAAARGWRAHDIRLAARGRFAARTRPSKAARGGTCPRARLSAIAAGVNMRTRSSSSVRCAMTARHGSRALRGGRARRARRGRSRVSLDLLGGVRRDPDAEHLYEPILVRDGGVLDGRDACVDGLRLASCRPTSCAAPTRRAGSAVGMRFFEPSPARSRAERARPVRAGERHRRRSACCACVRPARSTVEIMADFTDWEPVTLTPRRVGIRASVHAHRGARTASSCASTAATWRPATNTPAVDDDLGGRVGLLRRAG